MNLTIDFYYMENQFWVIDAAINAKVLLCLPQNAF